MMKEVLFATGAIVLAGGAFAGGYFASNYSHLKNTPESVIAKMEAAKEQAKAEQAIAAKDRVAAEVALNALKNTKRQYQDEIRPGIEAKVRKELQTYISEADKKYEDAKRQRELADLKLELVKAKEKNTNTSETIFAILGGAQ